MVHCCTITWQTSDIPVMPCCRDIWKLLPCWIQVIYSHSQALSAYINRFRMRIMFMFIIHRWLNRDSYDFAFILFEFLHQCVDLFQWFFCFQYHHWPSQNYHTLLDRDASESGASYYCLQIFYIHYLYAVLKSYSKDRICPYIMLSLQWG